MQTVVERELELNLVLSPERSIVVPARLTYRVTDPYAVHITFRLDPQTPVNWTFSRELLVEGVFRPCGHGDVRVWPTRVRGKSVICVALCSTEGNALLQAPAAPVASWLERTLRLVPPGRELLQFGNIDERLGELLAHGQPDELWLRDLWANEDEDPEADS